MRKRITSLLIALSMVFSAMPFFSLGNFFLTAYADDAPSGSGTIDDPYKIGSVTEFFWFRDKVNGLNGLTANRYACADLTDNISLYGVSWTPFSDYYGTFDGRNHDITNITGVRFFNRLRQGGTIKNVHLFGNLSGNSTSVAPIGWLDAGGNLYNVSFDGNIDVTGTGSYCAGLFGDFNAIDGSNTSNVQYCWTKGTYISNGSNCGGAIGGQYYANGSTLNVTQTYTTANVTAKGGLGGIVCESGNSGTTVRVTNCYVAGTLTDSTGEAYAGAFAAASGSNDRFYITNSHSYSPSKLYSIVPTRSSNLTQSGVYLRFGNTTNGTGVYYRTDGYFTTPGTFSGWNIGTSNIWKMGTYYPILKQQVADSSKSRNLVVYDNGTASYNLPDYFDLLLAENKDYNQDKRFSFSVFNPETKEYVTEYIKDGITVAKIDGDALQLNGEIGIGTYGPFTVQAVDGDNAYDAFTMDNFYITVKHAVPKPEVKSDAYEYSRGRNLYSVFLNDDWSWVDGSIVPRTDPDGDRFSYEAYYPFEAGKSEYYDLSELDEAEIAYTVDKTNNRFKAMLSPKVLESSETPITKRFIVTDADTDAPIPGARFSSKYADEFENGDATGEDGSLVASLSQGYRDDVTVSADYYEAFDDALTLSDSYEVIPISLTPVRHKITAPRVYLRDDDTEITDAEVTLTKADGADAKAWNGGAASLTVPAGEADISVPEGVYKVTNSTKGYSGDDVLYVQVKRDGENTVITYGSAYSGGVLSGSHENKLTAVKLTDPTYYVTISKDSSDASGLTYTASVELGNIKAALGTFGLRWDEEIFSLSGVSVDSAVTEFTHPYDIPTAKDYTEEDDKSLGYYIFEWNAREGTELDAEVTRQKLATFTFKLGKRSDADLITYDTFSVQPWDETVEARAYAKQLAKDDPDEDPQFWEYWRYYDADNTDPVKDNRLEKDKAVINDIDTKGFYQISKNRPVSEIVPQDFVDVKTQIDYKISVNNSVLKFHVYDSVTEEPLEGALVKLFDKVNTLKMFGAKETNYNGRASFAVNTKTAKETTFAYTAAINGYWPVPETGLTEDRPNVTGITGRAVEVDVPLEQKIYHKPVLKRNTAGEGQPEVLELVDEAQLGGQKYAYNGREYHFRVKAARGYKITAYPTEAYVYVNGDLLYDEPIKPDPNGQFKLTVSQMSHALYPKLAALSQSELDGLVTSNPEGYKDWEGSTQPTADGYRGYNLDIRFDHFSYEELEYIVEGVTNDGGFVTYDKDEGEDDCDITKTDENDPNQYIMVQTHNSQNPLGGPNHNTGTFTFTGNGDNVVEKVYINGLEVDSYNGEHSFSYSFDLVDMDNNITVLFWDGKTPSDDKVMTLVVGEFGFADTVTPVEEKDIMLTRRVYLNPEKLEFDAHAMIGFELASVEKEVTGTNERVAISKVSTETRKITENGNEYDVAYDRYSVDAPTDEEKNITVYVTFKNPEAAETPNLFVKSYVYSGKGIVYPAGILIYNKWDTVELDLQAYTGDSAPWLVKSVMVSDYYDIDNVKEFEYEKPLQTSQLYRWDTLEKDMAFGAVFMEKAYPLKGYVDLDQNSVNLQLDAPKTGAIVKFVRLDENGEEIAKQPLYMTTTTEQRKDALFEIELPAGDWNVYVTKQGYLRYELDKFKMKVPAAIDASKDEYAVTWFGQKDGAGDIKHVVPYIGSTLAAGKKITLTDAANVKSGWRQGVSDTVFNMADVNNDGEVNTHDMDFVLFNFNKRQVIQPYENFEENGSATAVTYYTN